MCLSQERQEAVSLTVQMTSPRNIGTQCETIDLESGSENVTMTKGLCFTESLKKYFGLGVQVSDPLLNAAKWIAYITEVKLEIFLLSKKKSISFKDWCHRYSGYGPVHIFPGCQYIQQSITEIAPGPSLESLLIFSIVSIFAIVTIGLMAFCYLHFLWVKPSRHLLVGVQQVTSRFFQ